jgi:fermentation-respiration switch protein FrsA (DUF1100 family)
MNTDAEPKRGHGWGTTLRRVVLVILIPYTGLVAMLAFMQRSMIYFPTRARLIQPADAELPDGYVHTISLHSDDDLQLRGWHILPGGHSAETVEDCDRELASTDPVFLYFSGNAGNRRYRVEEFHVLARLGCHVFLFDYRGYGDNPGSPSEERLAADARAVWRYATEQRGVSAERIVLYGESLGGGVAVRLAHDLCAAGTPPAGIVLRSTFPSLVDAAAHHYPWIPVRWLLVDRFPSRERIATLSCPILQIHGSRDSIVPIDLARELFTAAPESSSAGVPKRFVELTAANHNDVLFVANDEMERALSEFIKRL